MRPRFGFRPRLVPAVVALSVIALGVAAGCWQTKRAEQKIALKNAIEAAAEQPPKELVGEPVFDPQALHWRTVVASGTWITQASFFLDNRVHQGVVGYHVLTPLRLVDGRVVLVNRGWVAAGPDREKRPEVRAADQTVELFGQVRVPLSRAFSLGDIHSPDRRVWQQLRPSEIAATTGLPLAPFVIFQQSPAEDGLVRVWEAPDYGIDTHRAYAFQWFALAVLAAIYFALISFKPRAVRHEN